MSSELSSLISASSTVKAMLGKFTPFSGNPLVRDTALTGPRHRSPMGMVAIGISLYKYVMKYSPNNCNYFNRDRFVLSNGTSSVSFQSFTEAMQQVTQLTS